MARAKKKRRAGNNSPIWHEGFEGRETTGKWTTVTHDMMRSQAWRRLNLRQRGLYLELKSRYWRNRVDGETVASNANEITYPKSEILKNYGNKITFKKDLEALIKYGFVRRTKQVRDGGPNLYGFSAEWQAWDGVDDAD